MRSFNIVPHILLVLTIFISGSKSLAVDNENFGLSDKSGNYAISIDPAGFRFSIVDHDGNEHVPAHRSSGLLIAGQPVRIVESPKPGVFRVATEAGTKGVVTALFSDGVFKLSVAVTGDAKEAESSLQLSSQLGGMPLAHGLGDAGGWSGSFNLVGNKPRTFSLSNDGGPQRWISSFVVFPQQNFAGVVFGDSPMKVTIGPDEYGMIVSGEQKTTFTYFVGDMPTIYRKYLAARIEAGYPNIKPKYRLFELGWESWAALGYQTSASKVSSAIAKLHAKGFPVRWAVTGSGFWQQGGTTTSFGTFGEKFPDPAAFKKWLNDRDVKWMIGLRTNFVPSGGPFSPATARRDHNNKTNSYLGNAISETGLRKGLFLTDSDGLPRKFTSSIFPQVPCYLLNGCKNDAANWFADLFQKWGVDGIKEDTMMNCNYGIFNGPVAEIAERGNLVMARCGSFSAPGTLLRINDSFGVRNMGNRTPINYLHYASSGAPNVYSDTIGFRSNEQNAANVRHGWMMACTAGLSIGPFNWQDETLDRAFRRMIDFHYEIAPTKYDAAIDSYRTGYPFTMTPLSIAFPGDHSASQAPSFQWMIGESLLAAPLVKNINSNRLDVYLPEGSWYEYDSGKKHTGPKLLRDYEMPLAKTPVFVGGKGIIVKRVAEDKPLVVSVYPSAEPGSVFRFTHPDGESESFISNNSKEWNNSKLTVINTSSNQTVPFMRDQVSGAISFDLFPGSAYQINSAGQSVIKK